MENFIKIKEIEKKEKSYRINFDTSPYLKKFFNEMSYYAEYDFNIETIPDSILNISFLCNILPIAWLTNSTIIINTIDKDFYDSIKQFKKGYIDMYPMLKFHDVAIQYNSIEINKNIERDTILKSGTFFSGGVDAFATLFAHIKENPKLITVWGADIAIKDEHGWKKMQDLVQQASDKYSLEYEYIKSNFKEFLNTAELFQLIANSGEAWWHGFQHGIGLIGLASPISYMYGLGKIYIASSFTKGDKVTCASDPTIDNHVKYSNTTIIHDQYECDRQVKIENIVKCANETQIFPTIHVCWESTGGINCCKCEKCCRTMVGFMLANANPRDFGFGKYSAKTIEHRMKFFNDTDKIIYRFWNDMKNKTIEMGENCKFHRELKWLRKIKFTTKPSYIKKVCRKVEKICQKLLK